MDMEGKGGVIKELETEENDMYWNFIELLAKIYSRHK